VQQMRSMDINQIKEPLLPLLLLTAVCAEAAKLDNVQAFPSLGRQAFDGYLPPVRECTPVVSTVSRPGSVVTRQTTQVINVPGRDVVRTSVVTRPGVPQVRTNLDTTTRYGAGRTVTSYQQRVVTSTVRGQDVTVYTTLYTTRTNIRTATDYRVQTSTAVEYQNEYTTRVVPRTVTTTLTTTRYDERQQTRTVVQTRYSTRVVSVSQPAVTRYETVTRTVSSPPRTTTVYQTSVVTSVRYTTSVGYRVRTNTVRETDYETESVVRTSTRVQPTTVNDFDTSVRYTTAFNYRTVSVPGNTVIATETTSIRAPRPVAPPATTQYEVVRQTRFNQVRPVTRYSTQTTTVRQPGPDRVVTTTVQGACTQRGYNYNAPSVSFNLPAGK